MQEFDVVIKQVEIYYVGGVQAESIEEAKEKAEKILITQGKNKYHHDSDCEIEAF
jgi:hypothetical protein